MSSQAPPSLGTLDPKYVNSDTASRSFPSFLACLSSFTFSLIVFVFFRCWSWLDQISLPTLWWLLSCLVGHYIYFKVGWCRQQSPGQNLLMNFYLNPLLCLSKVFLITQSNNRRKRNLDIHHRCFTLLSILTQSDCNPLLTTHISLFSYSFCIVTIFCGTPYNSIISSVTLLIMLKVFFFKIYDVDV